MMPANTTPTTGPRQITFHANQQTQFKHRTLLIAWLCRRDGGWKNGNVTDHVHKMLRREGVIVPQSHVKLSFDWLVAEGYAITVVYGRRTREFILDPDVMVPTPPTIAARQARATMPAQPPATVHQLPAPDAAEILADEATGRQPEAPARKRTAPPVPKADPRQATFRRQLGEVTVAVMDWWAEDPAAAEQWVAAAAEALDA